MKSGLDEFLKRIEAKPTNETLIDRFMTLVLEEDGVDRILYLKSLVGLLLKTNPYAALKAAYVELQEARKEKLSNEYEIGALKDVESCFINLGKPDNAATVREEINKILSDARGTQPKPATPSLASAPTQKPQMPMPSQTAKIGNEFPSPVEEEGFAALPRAERTLMAPPPTRAMNELKSRGFEPKPIPAFNANEFRSAPAINAESETEALPSNETLPWSKKPASSQTHIGMPISVRESPDYSKPYVEEDIFTAPADLKEIRTLAAAEEKERLRVLQVSALNAQAQKQVDSVSFSAGAALPFSLTGGDAFAFTPGMLPDENSAFAPVPASNTFEPFFPAVSAPAEPSPYEVENDGLSENQSRSRSEAQTANESEDEFGFDMEYTKRTEAQIRSQGQAPVPLNIQQQSSSGFSLQDDDDDLSFSPAPGHIDEKYENQPFFQPDDDDDGELPPGERTMLLSLEKLEESQEQIELASTASESVDIKYPVNSGHNFVVLDTDEDPVAPTQAESAAPFDPDNIGATYNSTAFLLEDSAPHAAVKAVQPAPAPAWVQPLSPLPMTSDPTKTVVAGASDIIVKHVPFDAGLAAPPVAPTHATLPTEPPAPVITHATVSESNHGETSQSVLSAVVPSDDIDTMEHLSLVPTPSIVQKWTQVQERLKLFSGLQIGRSHAVDYVKRLLAAKTETPAVLKTLSLLLHFVEARLDNALCKKMGRWVFEDLNPFAMHQLWYSLNMQTEGLELFLDHLTQVENASQYRRSLSIMHDILRFELEDSWYRESYPHLLKAWDHLGLEGWVWLEEEGGGAFVEKLARREDPLLATLLV